MPLSRFYGAISNLRNTLYSKGVFKSTWLGVPTISVGNITVGGTGKTPLVAYISNFLAEKGEKVCILTRGYGRENPKHRVLVSDGETILANVLQSGDEPFELASKLLGKAVVIADADRVSAGIWAREKFGITAFVLDDGFQHQMVKRDLNIVTIDATNPFGNGKCLPGGILREPLANLKRADLIVITRANLSNSVEDLKSQISELSPNCEIVIAENRLSKLIEMADFKQLLQNSETAPTTAAIEPDTVGKAVAFCALGNPEIFFEMLCQDNIQLVATEVFPDHHKYNQNDVNAIEGVARNNGSNVIFTTAKDAVKLLGFEFQIPFYVVEQSLTFDDEERLTDNIDSSISKAKKLI